MPTVNTVLGPVETADLGFTLSHEHVGTNAAGLRHTYPEFLDPAGVIEQAVAAMREAYQEGVRTMVEVSTFDLGRDIGLIQEVSKRSGVHLIAATGNHLAVPRPFGEVSPDVIARLYSREIDRCSCRRSRSPRRGRGSSRRRPAPARSSRAAAARATARRRAGRGRCRSRPAAP